MPFVDEILKYRSLSVVGMEKNVGKTVTLNYLLQRLASTTKSVAVTSIGIDGEGVDQVTSTAKPDITLNEGTLFVTSEQHYRCRHLIADILALSDWRTSLGRLVAARALSRGQVLLSGPADTAHLVDVIEQTRQLGADITLVDGALSRMSLASPSVTDAMLLATGAAYSLNMQQLVRGTAFVCSLIELNRVDDDLYNRLHGIRQGVYAIDENGGLKLLDMPSAVLFERDKQSLFTHGHRLFVSGVVTDKFLSYIRMQKACCGYEIIVQDFTKLFVSPEVYTAYVRRGGRMSVLYKTNLVGVTVNPVSPKGYTLDSARLCAELSDALRRPVYDVMKL